MRPEPSFARSLVAWGNAHLAGRLPAEAVESWWRGAGHVRELRFDEGGVRAECSDWLVGQRARGVRRLALDLGPAPGFERVLGVGAQPITAYRQVWERIPGATAPPWFDALFVGEAPPGSAPSGRAVRAVLADLDAALSGLVALAERADLEHWGPHFAAALALARGEREAGGRLLPPTAPEDARRLAEAAALADVFGGMGSWNDFAPLADAEREEERARHSSLLFEAVRAALVATAHA